MQISHTFESLLKYNMMLITYNFKAKILQQKYNFVSRNFVSVFCVINNNYLLLFCGFRFINSFIVYYYKRMIPRVRLPVNIIQGDF